MDYVSAQKLVSNSIVIDMFLHSLSAAMFDLISIINCKFFTRKKNSLTFYVETFQSEKKHLKTVEVRVKFILNKPGMLITM